MKKGTVIKRILLSVLALAALAVCAGCVTYIYQYYRGKNLDMRAEAPTLLPVIRETVELGSEIPVPDEESPVEYIEISMDFDELKSVNSDIYAWIQVPGTVIDYPVLQSPYYDTFYNDYSSDGRRYSGGSIYSQKTYNSTSFDEPMVVLYGHNLKSGNMFSQLNNFADAMYFDEHRDIYIFTPEAVYRYVIYAAFPYDRHHLLFERDFSDPELLDTFYTDVMADSAPEYSNFAEELIPSSGEDRLITLSTCFVKSNYYRYLVQGVLAEVMYVVQEEADES